MKRFGIILIGFVLWTPASNANQCYKMQETHLQDQVAQHKVIRNLMDKINYWHQRFRGVDITQEQVKEAFLLRMFFEKMETENPAVIENYLSNLFYKVESWYYDIRNMDSVVRAYESLLKEIDSGRPPNEVIQEHSILSYDKSWTEVVGRFDLEKPDQRSWTALGKTVKQQVRDHATKQLAKWKKERESIAFKMGENFSEYRILREQMRRIMLSGNKEDPIFSARAQLMKEVDKKLGAKGKWVEDVTENAPIRPKLAEVQDLIDSSLHVKIAHLKEIYKRERRMAIFHLIMTSPIFNYTINQLLTRIKTHKLPMIKAVPVINFSKLLFDIYGTLIYGPDMIPILPKPGKTMDINKIYDYLRNKSSGYLQQDNTSQTFLITFWRHREFDSIKGDLMQKAKSKNAQMADRKFYEQMLAAQKEADIIGPFASIYRISHARAISMTLVAMITGAIFIGPGGDYIADFLRKYGLMDYDDEQLEEIIDQLDEILKELEEDATRDQTSNYSLFTVKEALKRRNNKLEVIDMRAMPNEVLRTLTAVLEEQAEELETTEQK